MQIQISSSPPFHSISNFIFILIFIIISSSTSSFSLQEEEARQLFHNCSSIFSCGKNFPNITYPFWGGSKHPDCGLDGFHLTCHQGDDYLTIDIVGRTFRVLDISHSSYAFRIARNDLWNNVCPENYSDASIDAPLFRLGGGLQNLPLYYDCYDPGPKYGSFSCTNITDNSSNELFVNDTGCESSITVWVLGNAYQDFRGNTSMTLGHLLSEGFDVEYSLEPTACLPCEHSGGLCWKGTNSTTPQCLCYEGLSEVMCSMADQAGNKLTAGNKPNLGPKIGIGMGAGLSTAVIICIIYVVYHCRSFMSTLGMKTKEDKNLEAFIRKCGSLAPKRYSYSDVKKITNSFKEELGQGGYGTVYKGKLSDGRLVAVKKLKISEENAEEFISEVLSIGKTSHVNIVMLLGFCIEGKRRALVYDYMPNGSLEKYVHGLENSQSCNQLGMDKLFQISLGVARGLDYLHQRCNTRILHFDIKPHNILLDKDFCPKISDFGLAKQYSKKESNVSILGARGTIGYIAPELVCFGAVSYKSDVYSYGMMILEIAGRRKNVNAEVSHTSEIYFPHWAYQHLIVHQDLRLKGAVTSEEDEIASKIILVGLWCIQHDPSQRPTMSKVIEMLEGSLQAIEIPPKAFFGFPTTPQASSNATVLAS